MSERNVLRRLYEEQKICVMDPRKEQIDFTNKATLIDKIYLRTVLAIYFQEKENAKYWSQPVPDRDHLLVNYLSTRLSRSQSNLINKFVLAKFESGLHHYITDFRYFSDMPIHKFKL